MPKVSVIIPAHNALPYLPAAVGSVLKQTYSDFEIIIVNDGSTDDTEAWVNQISDPRIGYIAQEQQGVSEARNTGMLQAQGEYIAFLDADDLWRSSRLEKQVQVLETSPGIGLVYSWIGIIDQEAQSTGRTFSASHQGKVWEKLLIKNFIPTSTVLARRCCFDQVGMFDRSLMAVEDKDMWLRIAACYEVAVVPDILAYKRQHPSSISANWKIMAEGAYRVIDKALLSPPSEMMPARLNRLKHQSYAWASMILAWKPLQDTHRNYEIASYFYWQALKHYPPLFLTIENLRWSLAFCLMRYLGEEKYQKILILLYGLRRQCRGNPYRSNQYGGN